MLENASICICNRCSRFFSLEGSLLAPQPSIKGFFQQYGIPSPFDCSEADCAAVAAAKADVIRCTPKPKLTTETKPKPSIPPSNEALQTARGCPADSEDDRTIHGAQPITQGHEAYAASAEASRCEKLLYDKLNESFDGITPGKWIPRLELRTLGIDAINSAAARIRTWPQMEGFDVDSKQVHDQKHWAYRLCRTSDSERIARTTARLARKKSKESL